MSEYKELTGREGIEKIGELIKGIYICMMTTAAPDGSIDSRPMATQQTRFDGSVWFLSRHETGKVRELENDAHVSLLYSDPAHNKFVTAKGRATLGRDAAKIHELWNPMFKAWFPEGETDPAITTIEVKISEAQYWEASSSHIVVGIKYLAAAVTGGQVNIGETGHVTV